MPQSLQQAVRRKRIAHIALLASLIPTIAVTSLLACTPRSLGQTATLSQQPPQATSPGVSAADLSVPPIRWAEAAAANEEHIVNYDNHLLLRYRVRKVDVKGEVIRQVIESRDGSVARLLERNGQLLTADEDTAERERLQAILDSPDAFLRRAHREDGSRAYATELLRSMPKAMIWTYAPGQPQLPGTTRPAIVLDFQPDPKFKPPSLITEGLTGIAGRLWVDEATHCVTRIQGRILHPVDFGWGGFLARIKDGGSIELEQHQAGNGRWLYSHLVERITIREVLIHTAEENTELATTDVEPLPTPISFREAVQRLLALNVPTR